MKGATLFGGGEGVGVGMRMAGIEHLWGIEYDAAISDVAKINGFNSLHLDILEADPQAIVAQHGLPDILHASPPCPNFSNAKTDGEETEEDIALAESVCRFINHIKPHIFTLENVWGYRNSQSWHKIAVHLFDLGYSINFWHLNAANFGVPQTRKRMVVVARRDGRYIQRPTATHTKAPRPMFDERQPWVGWYEAIEDLIPTLPDSEFAPWQLAWLPQEFSGSMLVGQNYVERNPENKRLITRGIGRPTMAATANSSSQWRAFLIDGANASRPLTIRRSGQPAMTITGNDSRQNFRACANGRIVKITPRALARFQSFPDDYQLPTQSSLACHVIGNAVPQLLYSKIIQEQL